MYFHVETGSISGSCCVFKLAYMDDNSVGDDELYGCCIKGHSARLFVYHKNEPLCDKSISDLDPLTEAEEYVLLSSYGDDNYSDYIEKKFRLWGYIENRQSKGDFHVAMSLKDQKLYWCHISYDKSAGNVANKEEGTIDILPTDGDVFLYDLACKIPEEFVVDILDIQYAKRPYRMILDSDEICAWIEHDATNEDVIKSGSLRFYFDNYDLIIKMFNTPENEDGIDNSIVIGLKHHFKMKCRHSNDLKASCGKDVYALVQIESDDKHWRFPQPYCAEHALDYLNDPHAEIVFFEKIKRLNKD